MALSGRLGPGLAPVTLNLEPGQSAVEALRDRRGRLCRPTIALYPDRPMRP